jgi:ribosomal protein S18 acetylase RimI-like enzyme
MGERDLGMAVEANLFALFRAMAAAFPGAEIEESPRACRHHASPFNPMFKGVWGLSGAVDDAHSAALDGVAWLRSRGAPFGFVWLGPSAPRGDLGARLERAGFAEFEHEAPGMAARLDDLDWPASERIPPGVTIGRAADEAGARGFAQAFVASYDVPGPVADAWVDATLAIGIDRAPWSFHVARHDGRPVACTIVFCGAGVASVFGVGTIPAARGRGIGAAITLSAYNEARERGYRYGVLFATDDGLPVYRRLGFRETGTAISRHLWWPGDA